MPSREALISTALILAVVLVIAGLVAAYTHHVLRQVFGAIILIGFLAFCLLI
jgi:hypothetical protein